MKIYKFKDLSDENKHSHFYQIVLKKAVWCAKPSSLNDEDEFKFKLNYEPSPRTADLLSQVVAKYRITDILPMRLSAHLVLQNGMLEEITAPIIKEYVIGKSRDTIGIASFSVTNADDHLWTRGTGGKGNGVCVEIEIPDKSIRRFFSPGSLCVRKNISCGFFP